MNIRRTAWVAAALAFIGSAAAAQPRVLYTDIVSGPNTGGENNKGIYLSVFGFNFGSSGLGGAVKVYINDVEVDNYRYLGPSRGRPDIDQITVQLGALGNPAPGVWLPIKVVVNGATSNTDVQFMVNPGDIIFVDNVIGNDATAVIGSTTTSFRHVQTNDLSKAAWGKAGPGDFVVMRGKGAPWTDVGFESYFMRVHGKSGSAPTGAAGTGPITLMGYPGEDVNIHGLLSNGMTGGCVSGINGESFPAYGRWAVVTNLRIDCEGYDGPISQQIDGDNWRVINNDLSAPTAPTSGPDVPRMGGITGSGLNAVWLGNHIHDIQGSADECHGIYIDGAGSYEVAYNNIHDIRSGNGFQAYSTRSDMDDISLHHNWIHDVNKHGINIADSSRNNISVYDNVVFNTSRAGIRFNSDILHGCKVHHNTFYNTVTSGNSNYGAVTNDWNFPSDAYDIENNIFWPHSGTDYEGGANGMPASTSGRTIARNLWFGGSGSFTIDASPVTGNPTFVVPGSDFHLLAGSPAINAGSNAVAGTVVNDYTVLTPRPLGAGFDIGAYEYDSGAPADLMPPAKPRGLRIR